jgi:hypothetical protein
LNYDNPAGRLLIILREGKKLPLSHTCYQAWFQLLKTDNHADMFYRLGILMQLSRETTSLVLEEFPDEGEAVGYWSGQLKNAFINQALNGQWQSFIQHIDDHSLNYLASESKLLNYKSNTKSVIDNDIQTIRDKLLVVYDEVLSNDIELEIKKYLIRYLRKILTGIDDYFLTGALPILEAVETAVGHANVDKEYKSFLLDTEFGNKILDTLAATANVVTVAVGLPQLTATIALLSANV